MVFIYILQLESGKYYIGKTTTPSFRLDQHFNSNGSNWTKKYKPTFVIELIPNCDDYDEDKYTIKYMEQYGINNVRGGSFCEIKLSDNNISTLNQMIRGVTNKCYICGSPDHFANECKTINVKKEKPIMNEKCNCASSHFFPHRRSKCALNKLISYYDDENDNIDKLKLQHAIIQNKILQDELNQIKTAPNQVNPAQVSPAQVNSAQVIGACHRCGRHGHYISSCYASTHVKGYSLK